ncbi:MAG: hypothetical protein K9L30_03750 [Desulfobacterales bacterium]|nr:hypothetical protein [Desulfobacterales bacterium]
MINITHHTIVIKKSSILSVFLGNGNDGINAFKDVIGYNDEMYPTLFSEDDKLIAFSSEMIKRNNISNISTKDLESMGFLRESDFTIAKQFPPSCKVNWLTMHTNLEGTFAEFKAPDAERFFNELDIINNSIKNIQNVLSDLYLMRRGRTAYNGEKKTYCTICGREKVNTAAASGGCPSCSGKKIVTKGWIRSKSP